MRQLGAIDRGRARNSCADEKSSGRQPASARRSSSDSRTEMSSSTTNTVGLTLAMGYALWRAAKVIPVSIGTPVIFIAQAGGLIQVAEKAKSKAPCKF